jgi:hypothetical protein
VNKRLRVDPLAEVGEHRVKEGGDKGKRTTVDIIGSKDLNYTINLNMRRKEL